MAAIIALMHTSLPVKIKLSPDVSAQYWLLFRWDTSWRHGTVVERRSLTGELSLSYARPAADG